MTVPTALLQLQDGPRLFVTEANASALQDAANEWAGVGLTVRSVRGSKMRSTKAMMAELSAALQFPYYFGANWAALDECLSDMEWLLPTVGIVLVVRDSAEVLVDEEIAELVAFIRVLANASNAYASPVEQGEWWDRPAVGFHVVLQTSAEVVNELVQKWRSLGAEIEALGL